MEKEVKRAAGASESALDRVLKHQICCVDGWRWWCWWCAAWRTNGESAGGGRAGAGGASKLGEPVTVSCTTWAAPPKNYSGDGELEELMWGAGWQRPTDTMMAAYAKTPNVSSSRALGTDATTVESNNRVFVGLSATPAMGSVTTLLACDRPFKWLPPRVTRSPPRSRPGPCCCWASTSTSTELSPLLSVY